MFFLNFSLVIMIDFDLCKFDYTRVEQNYADIDRVARKKYASLLVFPKFGLNSFDYGFS